MLELKAFIFEGPTVYGFPAASITNREVSPLDHKAANDTMKLYTFVVEWLARCLAYATFSCA